MGEDARLGDAAVLADELGRDPHVLVVGLVAGQAQRPVGLDRRREVARAPEEVGPRAVGALLGADPGRAAGRLLLAADAQELPQQQSSASIVTFVCSSPRHQPASSCSESRWSRGRLQRDPSLAAGLNGQLGHAGKLT